MYIYIHIYIVLILIHILKIINSIYNYNSQNAHNCFVFTSHNG